MKKTLRLIITLECNLSCIYCCNKLPEVNSKFIKKKLEDIDFNEYEAVCITGGEPLLRRDLMDQVLVRTDINIPVYLYTNGLLIQNRDCWVNGINIGIHYKSQIKEILENFPRLLLKPTIKLYVQDIHKEEYLLNIPDKYIKTWTMNDCFNNIETEDWVLLEE